MGAIHSQLLPSPKSVKGWGSAPDPPSNSKGERLCACQSDTLKGGAPIPIFAPGARNLRDATGSRLLWGRKHQMLDIFTALRTRWIWWLTMLWKHSALNRRGGGGDSTTSCLRAPEMKLRHCSRKFIDKPRQTKLDQDRVHKTYKQ